VLEYAETSQAQAAGITGEKTVLRKLGIAIGICIAALVALIAFGLIISRPLSEEKLKDLGVIEPDSLFTTVNGVKTRYVTMGEKGKPIVFIHGFSSSLYTWRSCLEPVSKQYRAFALDLKGFGFSGKPPSEYTIDEYVDFVIHFMDALELERATLCGNSMGGNIAWRAALKYPDRVEKLILVDASGYPSRRTGIPLTLRLGRLPGVGELLGGLTTRSRIRSSLESAYFDDAKVTDRTVDAYYYSLRTDGGMRAPLARLRSHGSDTEKWQVRIPQLSLPTLIVWGAKDTWIPVEDAEKFHRDISGAKLVIIPQCGHLPEEEKPDEFTVSILDFMSGSDEKILTDEAASPGLQGTPLTAMAAR
jgi:pimeloyl-ACP methyl ester carboxylesterase